MTIAEPINPTPSTTPPDWNAITEKICCPLCEYELRGLIEPRCPECGYRFDWQEVLEADRRPHPYLFEHHPQRNIWSFVRTKLAGFAPWRFWQKLKPTMPMVPRRLALYWVIHLPLLLLLIVAGFVEFWMEAAPPAQRIRQIVTAQAQAGPTQPQYKEWANRFGSLQKAIDTYYPDPYSWAGFKWLARRYWYLSGFPGSRPEYVSTCALLVLWPWLTFATLMIFQISMRRAQIKPMHVVRCTVYSCDMMLIAIAALVPIAPRYTQFGYDPIGGFLAAIAACVPLSALTLYKLGFAYRSYLRFPHAWPTVIVSQVIVTLAIAAVMSFVLFW